MKKEILTDRIRLTAPSLSDLEEMYALSSKIEVNLFNPHGPVKSIDETKKTLDYWIEKDWKAKGVGYYIVRELKTNAFIGYVGVALREFKKQEMLNLAYRINPEFQRKGYVIEACKLVISETKKLYPDTIIRVLTKKQNVPSLGVAKKLGFIYNPKLDNYPEKDDVNLFNVPQEISNQ